MQTAVKDLVCILLAWRGRRVTFGCNDLSVAGVGLEVSGKCFIVFLSRLATLTGFLGMPSDTVRCLGHA